MLELNPPPDAIEQTPKPSEPNLKESGLYGLEENFPTEQVLTHISAVSSSDELRQFESKLNLSEALNKTTQVLGSEDYNQPEETFVKALERKLALLRCQKALAERKTTLQTQERESLVDEEAKKMLSQSGLPFTWEALPQALQEAMYVKAREHLAKLDATPSSTAPPTIRSEESEPEIEVDDEENEESEPELATSGEGRLIPSNPYLNKLLRESLPEFALSSGSNLDKMIANREVMAKLVYLAIILEVDDQINESLMEYVKVELDKLKVDQASVQLLTKIKDGIEHPQIKIRKLKFLRQGLSPQNISRAFEQYIQLVQTEALKTIIRENPSINRKVVNPVEDADYFSEEAVTTGTQLLNQLSINETELQAAVKAREAKTATPEQLILLEKAQLSADYFSPDESELPSNTTSEETYERVRQVVGFKAVEQKLNDLAKANIDKHDEVSDFIYDVLRICEKPKKK